MVYARTSNDRIAAFYDGHDGSNSTNRDTGSANNTTSHNNHRGNGNHDASVDKHNNHTNNSNSTTRYNETGNKNNNNTDSNSNDRTPKSREPQHKQCTSLHHPEADHVAPLVFHLLSISNPDRHSEHTQLKNTLLNITHNIYIT